VLQFEEAYDWTQEVDQDGNSPAAVLANITGTPLWAPLSVLEGSAHTVSSMLEGLFISILSISCEEKIDGYKLARSMTPSDWATFRRGAMTRRVLAEVTKCLICPQLLQFVCGLQDLFYPLRDLQSNLRGYRKDVTGEEVRAVCKSFSPEILLDW